MPSVGERAVGPDGRACDEARQGLAGPSREETDGVAGDWGEDDDSDDQRDRRRRLEVPGAGQEQVPERVDERGAEGEREGGGRHRASLTAGSTL